MDVRRLAAATAATLPVMILAACGGGNAKTATSTIPTQTTTSAPTPSSVPTTTATSTASPLAFQVHSVTFVSTQLGWVIGTIPCASTCPPVLLRTEDAGRSWTRVTAPPIDDATSVQSVRFADSADGWVTTRDSVWATHDGGAQWNRPAFPGVQPGDTVSDVEAAAGVVHAVFTGPPIQIETSPVRADAWALSPTTVPVGAGPIPSEQIVLQGHAGWLIEVDRGVIGGARLDNGVWMRWDPPCSQVGSPVTGPAVIAASDPVHLAAVCSGGEFTGPMVVLSYFSNDGGSTFQIATAWLPTSSFGPIASPAPGVVVMGSSTGDLLATFDGGATWKLVYHPSAPATCGYVGFTTPDQGVAIEYPSALLMTFDRGLTWAPVTFPLIQP